jgi:hypothetical protein
MAGPVFTPPAAGITAAFAIRIAVEIIDISYQIRAVTILLSQARARRDDTATIAIGDHRARLGVVVSITRTQRLAREFAAPSDRVAHAADAHLPVAQRRTLAPEVLHSLRVDRPEDVFGPTLDGRPVATVRGERGR